MEHLQNGQFAAPAERLRVNLEVEPVAAPADNRCRGGEHTGVGYESSQISCPFALLREVMGSLQNGQVLRRREGCG